MALPPNPLQSFIWGRGGAALTPEQVARERAVAESLMAQGIDTSPVGHWTQGAARMANVLAGKIREGRASRAETAGRTAFSDRLSSILGGSPATSTAMATAPAPDYANARVAQAHNAGGATVPTGERAEYIRQGLLNRGLPGHVADAFLMNFQDESGLNPGINEVAPLVPGSRGGYGLYQLTGPRRREYEAFAAERGSPLDDIDAQLDFLMREGSGSERAAFDRILAAPDTGTAASEIVNRFLRPAQAHRESRAARYSRAPNTAVAANEAMASGSLAGVPVAETPQDVLAQEAAMAAQDPMAFQKPSSGMSIDDPMLVWDAQGARMAPSYQSPRQHPNSIPYSGVGAQSDMPTALPEPRMVNNMPVADIAQSLTRATVNPDLPMAGNTSGFLPVAQSLAAQPQQQGGMPNMQQLIELASDPWATDAQRGVVQALLQQQMQSQDPMRQAQLEKLRLETEALRNPTQKPIEVGGVLLDPNTMQPIFDSRDNTPSNVREYEYYANAETAAGRQPMPFGDWDLSRRGASATQISNVVGGESDAYTKKFNESMGAAQAKTFTDAMEAGDQAQRNRINIDRLSQLASTTPQGFQGAIINTLGEFGIPTEGLDKVQAMESLISQLVPTQRPPGSGTISDADLKLYKASLPRLINTPEGNRLILETMYAINDHDIAASEIASQVAAGELTPAEARKQMRALPNPFDDWQDRVNASQGREEQNTAPVAGSIVDGYRFKGGDPANPNNWEKQ